MNRVVFADVNTRRTLGWLLLVFAALLIWSQTVAVFHFLDHKGEGFAFPRRYAIESSMENYGLAFVVLFVGILVLRSSGTPAAWASLVVAFVALWLMVGRELWLHYFELPRKYPHFANAHPAYFTGAFWMLKPRFLWHLILPVVAILSALHAIGGSVKSGTEPCASPNGGPATRLGDSNVTEGPPSVS